MKQLLKADFFRLVREVPFLVVTIIYLAFNILSIAININYNTAVGEMILAQNSIGNLGVFTAIAISIFNGRDFTFNTIRNKITAGYRREQIFFTSFIMNQIMYAVLFVAGAFITLGFGSFMLQFYFDPMFALDLLMLFLLGSAFCAFITFFSFATKKTSGTMLIGILVGALGYGLISIFTIIFVSYYFVGISNYAFLEFISRINIFSLDFLILYRPIISSLGESVEVTSFVTGIYINATVVAIVWAGLSALGGWLVFRRADVK